MEKSNDEIKKNFKIYIGNMEEIKKRQSAIDLIIKEKFSTPFKATNIEFCALQLRKILELIILSSLITNKEKYLEVYDNIAGEWNIKKIIEKVKILNDNYFPKPISSKKMDIKCQIKCLELGFEKDKITDDIFNIDNGALIEYEVKKAYYKLSNYLHSKNPFAKEIKYEKIMSYIIEITNKTIKLLNRHQIFLYDKNYFFYVFMKDAETGNVGENIFEKLELKKS